MKDRPEIDRLRSENNLLLQLSETVPTAILVFQNNKWTYVNHYAEVISGYSRTEMTSMNFWDLVHPDYRKQAKRNWRERLKSADTTRINRYQLPILTKDGSEKWIDVTARYLEIDNAPTGLLNVNDITEQKIATYKLEQMVEHSAGALARSAEIFDTDTGDHTRRIGECATLLADLMGLDTSYQESIKVQAQLHDVGKIHVPSELINKPGRLTPAEFEIIKAHTEYGGIIIGRSPELALALQIALHHHEKWDGSGYPDGLKGHEIPLAARIVSIADVFDALVSERSYKKAFSYSEARRILQDGDERLMPDKHFDTKILKLFLSNYEKFIDIHHQSLLLEQLRREEEMHILVIDDDPLVREMVHDAYSLSRYPVRLHSYGDIRSMRSRFYALKVHPTMCYIDMMLPDGSGDEVALELRERFSESYLICITASSSVKPEQVSLYDRLLHKPFAYEKLLKISEMIRKYY